MNKISVNAFRKKLKEELEAICEERSWDWEKYRGYAFQLWCANLLCAEDRRIETTPDDSMLYARDLKADCVLEDSVNKTLIITQCKYSSLTKPAALDEDEIVSFFSRHKLFLDKNWVRKHGSKDAYELLGDYRKNVAEGYRVYYYFFATGKAQSERLRDVVDSKNREYQEDNQDVECLLYDFDKLKALYTKSLTIEESIPDSVAIDLPAGKFIEKTSPYLTLVAIVKGSSILSLFKKEKASLFAFNIRDYLGDRGINKEITATADTNPENFYYFNNGISAVCTNYEVKGNTLTASKFQIINGAQTVGAINRSLLGGVDIEVLLRVTKTKSVATEKGINEDIIRYSNTQNTIKVSDFRANDDIQRFLERKLNERKPNSVLKKLAYRRKRTGKKAARGSQPISLEDLAKIRYAYFFEPTLVLATPRDLWTPISNNGVYEKVFGVNGALSEVWDDEMLEENFLAIALFLRIDESARKIARERDDLRAFGRLKYFALALISLTVRDENNEVSPATLLNDSSEFSKFFEGKWDIARKLMTLTYNESVRANRTIYALSRNTDEWQKMKENYLQWDRI